MATGIAMFAQIFQFNVQFASFISIKWANVLHTYFYIVIKILTRFIVHFIMIFNSFSKIIFLLSWILTCN